MSNYVKRKQGEGGQERGGVGRDEGKERGREKGKGNPCMYIFKFALE